MDAVGLAGSQYRTTIYKNQFSGDKSVITKQELLSFTKTASTYLEHSIKLNKRSDGMYHAYNLMSIVNESEAEISNLPEMLEGQVAVLSSGLLDTQESLSVLDSLKESCLFREDQYSYILYPNKDLPRFVNKNIIPKEKVESSALLQNLLADGNNQLINQDISGIYHFNGNFNNVNSLKDALANLPSHYDKLVDDEKLYIEDIFEDVFEHKSFTGRSGTFFGYEGLGSIYWHMVSKLLLVVYEITKRAIDNQDRPELIGRLFEHYFEINAGVGAHKSPKLYGAFPTDPYSHTPAGKGAQQPGMTGQVKEDILSRFGELGIRVNDGKLGFDTKILREDEFLVKSQKYNFVNVINEPSTIDLESDSLAFTYCQVPIVYKKSNKSLIEVVLNSGETKFFSGKFLDQKTTQMLFQRGNFINKIIVSISMAQVN
jgi:hypothetical protein